MYTLQQPFDLLQNLYAMLKQFIKAARKPKFSDIP